MDEPHARKGWLFQLRREHVFVQRDAVTLHFHKRIFKEWERESIARGKDNDVNVLLHRAVLENGSCLRELLHFGFHLDESIQQAAGKVVIQHRFFQKVS